MLKSLDLHAQEWKINKLWSLSRVVSSWMLIGCTRVNTEQPIRSLDSKLIQLLTMATTYKFPPQLANRRLIRTLQQDHLKKLVLMKGLPGKLRDEDKASKVRRLKSVTCPV